VNCSGCLRDLALRHCLAHGCVCVGQCFVIFAHHWRFLCAIKTCLNASSLHIFPCLHETIASLLCIYSFSMLLWATHTVNLVLCVFDKIEFLWMNMIGIAIHMNRTV
jgi:hypothetical protein